VTTAPAVTALVVPTNDEVLLEVKGRVAAIVADAAKFVVTAETVQAAADQLVEISRVKHRGETRRTALVGPHNNFVRDVNKIFKDVLGPLDQADRTYRDKITAFNQEQNRIKAEASAAAERRRLEAEALFNESAKAEQDGQVKVAEQLLIKATESDIAATTAAQVAQAPALANTIRAAGGSVTGRQVWKWEVEKPEDVPREYLMVDEVAVERMVKAGARNIPGIRIFPVESLQVRTA
jgi:hypothetical protein